MTFRVIDTERLVDAFSECWSSCWEVHPGPATRDPARWYHEELSNDELLGSINNAAGGDGIVVSRSGTILGGRHRWYELQRRINDRRIGPCTPVRIEVYDGE